MLSVVSAEKLEMKFFAGIFFALVLLLSFSACGKGRPPGPVFGVYEGEFKTMHERITLLENGSYLHEVRVGEEVIISEVGNYVISGRHVELSDYTGVFDRMEDRFDFKMKRSAIFPVYLIRNGEPPYIAYSLTGEYYLPKTRDLNDGKSSSSENDAERKSLIRMNPNDDLIPELPPPPTPDTLMEIKEDGYFLDGKQVQKQDLPKELARAASKGRRVVEIRGSDAISTAHIEYVFEALEGSGFDHIRMGSANAAAQKKSKQGPGGDNLE
jgi:hypothetical protein